MQKQKKGVILTKFTALIFCISLGIFSAVLCVQAGEPNDEGDTYIDINQDTTWRSTDNLAFSKMVYVNPGATLTIEKGAKIKFQKDINGGDTELSITGGRLIANGTKEEPISITASSDEQYYVIEFSRQHWDGIPDLPPSFLRYVEIYGGGYEKDDACPECSAFWKNFISPVYAKAEGVPAMFYSGGQVHLENCNFHNNAYADVGIDYNEFNSDTGADNYLEIINSNFEKSSDSLAVISQMKCEDPAEDCAKKVLLKNNWYGDTNGPSEVTINRLTNGKIIIGTYDLDDWRRNDLIVDPAIFIPGIMGSALQTSLGGKLVIDPIMHIYDNLILSFESNGYVENKNIFEFPYEWRDSNVQTASLLKQKIDEVKSETKISKVNLVAHSMGGLVARYYIEGLNYQDDVDKLITLGTPHRGAPADYLKWEAGEGFEDPVDKLAKFIFQMEAFHATGSSNLKNYIQSRVLSVQELLPDYDYLKEASTENVRIYPDNYPRNTFLELINKPSELEKLKKVNFTNIIGSLVGKENTITGFKVVNNSDWANGIPENYGTSNSGIEFGKGDETVPLESSEGVAINDPVEIDATHNDLPTVAQCDVIEKLTGKNTCSYVDVIKRVTHILTFGVFSPIDLQVIAPDGVHWAGKNIKGLSEADQIDGAYYTGYNGVLNEFLTISNPQDGEYKIVTEGTGDGEYTVKVAKISEEENDPGHAIESEADIVGTAVKDMVEESAATVSGDTVTTEKQDTTPPTLTASVSPEPNENGWNNTDVTVHFAATDDSGIKSVTPDTTLTNEGQDQSVIGTAEDNAGNVSSKTVSSINIDKTPPTTTVDPIGTKGNNGWYTSPVTINFSAIDNLSGVGQTFHTLDGTTEETGNTLTISTDGVHQIKFHSIDQAGNPEGDKTMEIKIDQVAPTIDITSPENTTYKNNMVLTIGYSVSDGQSAADKIVAKIIYDGEEINQNKIDLSLEKLGTHSVSAVATDEAGNVGQETKIDFTVITDIEAMAQNVKHYYSLGLIKKMSTEIFLQIKLRNIQEMMHFLDAFQSRWMPAWAKDRIVQNLKQNINHQIDDLEWQIRRNKNFARTIDPKIQTILLEDLEAVRW